MTIPDRPRANPCPAQPVSARRARALLGWLDPGEARLALAGRRQQDRDLPELAARVEKARAAVAARPAGIPRAGSPFDPPPVLRDHVQSLASHPAVARLLNEGWELKLVDLTEVCPIQGYVFDEHPVQTSVEAAAGDIRSLAELTLPLPRDSELPVQYDTKRRAWVLNSTDFNLRLLGEFQERSGLGLGRFGFVVGYTPSLLRVASYGGRLFLLDGTHRSFGLLRRGVRRVPALFKEVLSWPALGDGPAYLSPAVLTGERPPRLSDFLDPDFYAEVRIPISRRVLVVEATELTLIDSF